MTSFTYKYKGKQNQRQWNTARGMKAEAGQNGNV